MHARPNENVLGDTLYALIAFLDWRCLIRNTLVLLCVFNALGSAIEKLPERALDVQNKIFLTHRVVGYKVFMQVRLYFLD